jgi:hypothetical protein
MKVAAPPYSPPVENPWIIRRTMRPMGARIPMETYPGRMPTQKVAAAMRRIVVARTFRRPSRSPSGPQTIPPSGRMRNDTAKTRRLPRVDAVSFSLGKNASPM